MDHKLLQAISFACQRHQGQMRKDAKTPYVAHPSRVMTILLCEFGVKDVDILCAAVLHDTIEDTTTDRDDVESRFGRKVARWVATLTKDKRLPDERREHRYFRRLGKAPIEVKLCKLGDTLDNLIDSKAITPEGQRKAVAKAKKLVALFEPDFPKEWVHALNAVKTQIKSMD